MARGWVLVLCAFLLVWEPLTFGGELAQSLGTLGMRGPLAVVELFAHAAVAAIAVAAAWGLWIGNPQAPAVAAIALAAWAAIAVQSLYWTRLPGNAAPGEKLPLAIAAVAHAAGWIAYLRRSRHVRAVYD
jgi:hypothetical protein